MLAFLSALSPWHLLLIGIVAVVLFGNRLPEVARSLGRSVNEFKRGLRDVKDEFDDAVKDDQPRDRLGPPPEAKDSGRLDHDDSEESAEETKETSESHESRSR